MAGKAAEKGTLDNESGPVSMSSLKEQGGGALPLKFFILLKSLSPCHEK